MSKEEAEEFGLAMFLERNPESEIELLEDNSAQINRPWGDSTLAINLEIEDQELINCLNGIRISPVFTAIWHVETKDLECIFGVLAPGHRCNNRKFTFGFLGKNYNCEYEAASETLRKIALATTAVNPPTDTDYRHLIPIRSFFRRLENGAATEKERGFDVISFWVRNADLEEDELPDFARHLNFFMAYCDPVSPRIEVRDEMDEDQIRKTLPLFEDSEFPDHLSGQRLDSIMLSLWESGWTSKDTVRKFLHNYQIIEYAAYYFLQQEVLSSVKQILKAPDIASRPDDTMYQIVDAVNSQKIQDDQKVEHVVKRSVSLSNLWRHIEPRKSFFSESCLFDGGLKIDPLLKQGHCFEDFEPNGLAIVTSALRRIRNCLVHARETKHNHAILPTGKNRHLLRPWADLTEVVASEIMLMPNG